MNTSRPAQVAPRLPVHETLDELPYGELEDREDYLGLNLSDHTFPSVDGVTFKQVRLKEIDWKDAFLRRLDLTDVWLGACNMANAKWEHTSGERVVFDSCLLTGLAIKAGSFKHVTFRACQGRFLQFDGCNMQGARFERCVLTEASFVDCDMTGAVFIDCELRDAGFKGSKLQQADFRQSDLEASRVAPGELRGAVVSPMQAVSLFARLTGAKVEDEPHGE